MNWGNFQNETQTFDTHENWNIRITGIHSLNENACKWKYTTALDITTEGTFRKMDWNLKVSKNWLSKNLIFDYK